MKTGLSQPTAAFVERYKRLCVQRLENAALVATDRAAKLAKERIRQSMSGAGLGKLGNAIGSGSDLAKGRRVHRTGESAFSVSGWVHVPSKNERTMGALESYIVGADIVPRRDWLWIATDEIPKKAGRFRMTPARYNASGLVQRIGPLIQIEGRHPGEALLVVRNVTRRKAGKSNPRAMPRSGRVSKGREATEYIVAFVGIKQTSRQARVDVMAILRDVQKQLPALISQALGVI